MLRHGRIECFEERKEEIRYSSYHTTTEKKKKNCFNSKSEYSECNLKVFCLEEIQYNLSAVDKIS
jgi:hypothetical protein